MDHWRVLRAHKSYQVGAEFHAETTPTLQALADMGFLRSLGTQAPPVANPRRRRGVPVRDERPRDEKVRPDAGDSAGGEDGTAD